MSSEFLPLRACEFRALPLEPFFFRFITRRFLARIRHLRSVKERKNNFLTAT
jgi:hypothetical protein